MSALAFMEYFFLSGRKQTQPWQGGREGWNLFEREEKVFSVHTPTHRKLKRNTLF